VDLAHMDRDRFKMQFAQIKILQRDKWTVRIRDASFNTGTRFLYVDGVTALGDSFEGYIDEMGNLIV
jgi:hypothetical protein